MKKVIKKTVALLMTAIMLLSLFSIGIFAVADESQYQELLCGDELWAYISEDGTVKYRFTPEYNGDYYFYTRTHLYATFITVYDGEGNTVAEQQGSDDSRSVCVKAYLEEGETYYFEVGLLEATAGNICVGIGTLAVSSVYVEPISIIENTCGYLTNDGENEYYYYNIMPEMKTTVTMTDGTVVEGNGYGFDYNGQWWNFDWSQEQSFENRWTAGNEYAVHIATKGASEKVVVSIEETPVKSINVHPISYYEKTNGYVANSSDKDGNPVTYYEYGWINGLTMDIEYKDGTSESISFNSTPDIYERYKLSYSNNQSYENQWVGGNTYTNDIYLLGYKAQVSVEIKETPFTSLSIEPVRVIEGTNCDYTRDYDWETDTYTDYYYRYHLYNNIKYTVTTKDGQTITDTGSGLWYNGIWFSISFENTQNYENRWTVGNSYTVNASLGTVSTSVSYTIEQSPVKNITFTPISIIENTKGYFTSRYNYETGETEEFYYYSDYTGSMEFTVEFNNGETQTYYGGGFHYDGQWCSLSVSGDNQYEEHWTAGNTYNLTVSAFGKQYSLPVTIKENPIDYLDIPPVVLTEDDASYREGYNGETGQWEGYNYYYWWENLSYDVVLKDGTVLTYDYGIEIDGDWYTHSRTDSQSLETPFIKGNTYTETITLLGVSAEVNITIAEEKISDGYKYILQDESAYITGYVGDQTVLSIPETLGGKTVTAIIAIDNSSVTEITLPDSVTTLSQGWLYYCDSLEKLTVGAGVKKLDNWMFYDCTRKLTTINVSSKNVKYASLDGIVYDKLYTTVVVIPFAKTGTHIVPSTVTDIEVYIENFYNVTLDFSNCDTGYKTVDGVLMNEDETVIYRCTAEKTGEYIIPDTVKEIAMCAFQGSNISSVTVPSGVTEIAYGAFLNCKNLAEVVLPDTVAFIGPMAFMSCTSLKEVELPTSLECIEWDAFSQSGIEKAHIPASVYYIGSEAYCDTPLSDLTFEEGIEAIEFGAFAYTSHLKSVTLPDSLVYLGGSAFKGSGIESITFGSGLEMISRRTFMGSALKSVTVPENITYIGESAFENCENLTEVVLESDEVLIDMYAFMNSPVNKLTLKEGVTEIYDYAFYGSGLTKLKLPESVTHIQYRTFENSKDLAEIDVSDSLESLCGYAFHGTKWYNDMPDGSVYLENSFYDYKGEISQGTIINIKEGTKLIANYAFADAQDINIKSITLPSTLTHIGGFAFYGALRLENINIAEGNESFTYEDDVLYDKDGNVIWAKPIEIVDAHNLITRFEYGEKYHFDYLPGLEFLCAGDNYDFYSIPDTIEVIGYNPEKLGYQTVTIKVADFEYSYEVFVSAPKGMPTCEEIRIEKLPKTTEFDLNQNIRTNGMVVMGTTYDGEEVEVDGYEIIGYNPAVAGEQTVTVSYYGVLATFKVTVNPAKVTFTSTTTEEKIEVSVPQEVIEEGTQLKVEKLEVETAIKDVVEEITEEITEENSLIFDISFEKEDEEVQPVEQVTVSIPVPEHIDGNRCKVFHIGANGYEELEAVFRDGFMVFETAHFSYYGIVQAKGSLVSGAVESFGKADAPVTLSLYKNDNLVEEITSTDGTYSFEDIIEGEYVIEAVKASHLKETFTVTVGDSDVLSNLKLWLIGDVDCDDKVGTTDLANLKLYVAGADTDIKLTAADVDTNGAVNTSDLATLKLFVAGAITFEDIL